MVWAATAIGGATALYSAYQGKKAAGRAAAGQRDAAALADPFGPQRGQYQGILSNLYGGMTGAGEGAIDASQGKLGPFGSVGPMLRLFDKARGGLPTTQEGAGVEAPTPMAPKESSIAQFIKSSPDYQFRLAEGQRAIERSAAARGQLKSGGLLRALIDYGQGQAAGAYESEINRIMTMAGATMGSPGVAGQLASQAAMTQQAGTNQMMGSIGYGINQGINAYMNRPLQTAPAGAIGSTPSWYGTGGMGTIT